MTMTQIWMLCIVVAMVVFIILQAVWTKGAKAREAAQKNEPQPTSDSEKSE